MINIVYVLSSTTPFGGGTKSFLTLLDGMLKKGIKAYIIAPDCFGIVPELKKKGAEIIILDYRYSIYPYLHTFKDYFLFFPRLIARKWLNRKAATLLADILKDKNISLIHTNVSVIDIGFRAAKKLGIPHLWHIREYADKDFDMHYFPSKAFFRKQIKDYKKSYTVCITKDIQFHHQLELFPRSRVIYDAIFSDSLPNSLTISSKQQFLLFAGRIEPSKGLDVLLRAYSLSGIDIPLYVAGEVSDQTYFNTQQRYIKQHGMTDKVSFLGQVSNITDLMRQAQAIIIPSRSEGFGRCMPEAMAVGCLCIGRNTGGTKEQLDNGLDISGEEIGFRFNSETQLASQLKEINILSSEHYKPYIERAYKTVCKLYSLENNQKELYKYYLDIINETH